MSVVANELESRPLPWFTPADFAELDVLAWTFVIGVKDHVARCADCAPGRPWCEYVREAFDAILDWRAARQLRTRAEWLREAA